MYLPDGTFVPVGPGGCLVYAVLGLLLALAVAI